MAGTVDLNGGVAVAGSHTNECATKEYVQKEHKETTRLIIGVALGMVAIMGVTVALVSVSFEKTVGSRLEDLRTEVKETRLEVKELRAEIGKQRTDIQGFATGQAKIEGYIMAKQPNKP